MNDFYRYLRSTGRPHAFAKNIANSVNKYLYWVCHGQELSWNPITNAERIKNYVDILHKTACLSECSICSFISSIERARQFAEYRKLIGKIECKDTMFLNDLLAHYRSLHQLRISENALPQHSAGAPIFIDPVQLSKVIKNPDYNERFNELAAYAKSIVELKSWKTFDRRNFTFCLRYVLAHILLECNSKLFAVCNMTFSDLVNCDGSIDDPISSIKITVAELKFSRFDKATIKVSGDTKRALVNFAHFIRRVVPKVLNETRSLVFTNSSGRKLCPAQINKHLSQYITTDSTANTKATDKDEENAI